MIQEILTIEPILMFGGLISMPVALILSAMASAGVFSGMGLIGKSNDNEHEMEKMALLHGRADKQSAETKRFRKAQLKSMEEEGVRAAKASQNAMLANAYLAPESKMGQVLGLPPSKVRSAPVDTPTLDSFDL